ncbi:hypothetical protein PG996_001903 [Apiospora saccharicola]|uniref:Metallo-beta-lactamase domain-containing protein n=1 Tax=Apiospora saccharicola TaxID=335842 RepID=A0ABR1WJC0_9PEZI
MALTIKHLNEDASFLLSFEPILPPNVKGTVAAPKPYIILLDPWITGPSKIFHSKISVSTHKNPACVATLSELPEPDLVIISQHKSDHCNEATLRQLPGTGTKTQILAEPASARVIKSWKYFDSNKIWTIPKWEDPRLTGKSTVIRVPVPAVTPDGQPGEVTVAWIPQKRDLACLHSAIALTYRPPSTDGLAPPAQYTLAPPLISPPATPRSVRSIAPPFPKVLKINSTDPKKTGARPAPLTPPMSPTNSVLFARSAAEAMPASPTDSMAPAPLFSACRPISSAAGTITAAAQHKENGNTTRPLSLIFSPHGINYAHLAPYASSHLVSEAALPLTALLHCMDSISNPWWLGGNICAGLPAGAEIARRLCARVWLSAHDGDKDVKGLATGLLKTRKYGRDEVLDVVSPGDRDGCGSSSGSSRHMRTTTTSSESTSVGDPCGCEVVEDSEPGYFKRIKSVSVSNPTDVFRLSSGEEVAVRGDGRVCMFGGDQCSTMTATTASTSNTISSTTSSIANGNTLVGLPPSIATAMPDLEPVEEERLGSNESSAEKEPVKPLKNDTAIRKDDNYYYTTSDILPPHLTTMAQESWGPQKLCDTLSLPKITVDETKPALSWFR